MDATHDNLSIAKGNMNFRSSGCTEFTIGELLADPLTGALMRADRVEMDDFQEMLRSVSRRLQSGRAPAQPTVKFVGDAKPYPPLAVGGNMPSREFESGATRSTQAEAAVKAAKSSCGSRCPW